MATTRHRSLIGRGGRKAFVRDKKRSCALKKRGEKCRKNPIFKTLKKKGKGIGYRSHGI